LYLVRYSTPAFAEGVALCGESYSVLVV
jgi:hypothetical protein